MEQQSSIAACLAPSPPWCALKGPGASTTAWRPDCRDRWALPLSASASMTLSSSSTPKAQTVSASHSSVPPLMDVCSSSNHIQRFPFCSDVGIGSRLLAGCTTGAMAVALAQPTDVVKVRFQARTSTSGPSRHYQGTMDAYKTIAKEEGIRGLWRGNICLKGVGQFFSLCIAYVLLSTCRYGPKHCTQCNRDLHRAGDVWPHQRFPAEINTFDWWVIVMQYDTVQLFLIFSFVLINIHLPYRWPTLPLHISIWCWFLYYCNSLPCWCSEDKIYELCPGPV